MDGRDQSEAWYQAYGGDQGYAYFYSDDRYQANPQYQAENQYQTNVSSPMEAQYQMDGQYPANEQYQSHPQYFSDAGYPANSSSLNYAAPEFHPGSNPNPYFAYYDGPQLHYPEAASSSSSLRNNNNNNTRQNNRSDKRNGHHPKPTPLMTDDDVNRPRMTESQNSRKTRPAAVEGVSGRVDDRVADLSSQRGRLEEALCRGTYECMVCCVRIKHEARTWTCAACFNMFHLHCARKWARSPAAAAELPPPPDVSPDFPRTMGWRCPACRHIAKAIPQEYFCFCGKVKDPEFDRMETPHSCGEVCGRPKGKGGSLLHSSKTKCPHMCTLLCHPGPCPACTAYVKQICECGKKEKNVKCSQDESISCGEICDEILNCGKHKCERLCHKPLCEKCPEVVVVKCCCGKNSESHECSPTVPSTFTCDETCGKALGCDGDHKCENPCHPGDCGSCPLLPSVVTHCPCGKTRLESLPLAEKRSSCGDPIPVCGRVCGKALPCGDFKAKRHFCPSLCHEGPCPPCGLKSNVPCSCGATTRKMECKEMLSTEGRFLCDRKCNKKMSCGRHKCGQPCCSLKDHTCREKCGKKLSCRRHNCEDLCHKGKCESCPNVSFDELSCHCGSSMLAPPIHCGTRPPPCEEPCRRVHDCVHPVSHSCHADPKCPPCPVLLSRMCMGGHQKRNNIPCYLKEVSCGLPCKKSLSDCDHLCKRTCHKGQCQVAETPPEVADVDLTLSVTAAAKSSCNQPCSNPRADCGHPCNAPCHGRTTCPRTVCKLQIKANCGCGRKSKTIACPWGASQESHVSFQKLTTEVLASKFKDMRLGNAVDISDLQSAVSGLKVKNLPASGDEAASTPTPGAPARNGNGAVILECDDDCRAMERNKRFAEALSLNNADFANKIDPAAATSHGYTPFLKEQARKSPQFVASIEEKIVELVADVASGKKPKTTHSFPPMKSVQRQVIHELAEAYGCASVSYDEDPKRNVVVTARKEKAAAPTMTLTVTIQREMNPRGPVPIPLGSTEETLRSALAVEKRATSLSSWAFTGSSEGREKTAAVKTASVAKPATTAAAPVDYFDYFDG